MFLLNPPVATRQLIESGVAREWCQIISCLYLVLALMTGADRSSKGATAMMDRALTGCHKVLFDVKTPSQLKKAIDR